MIRGMRRHRTWVILVGTLLACGAAAAKRAAVGSAAPEFAAAASTGKTIRLSDFKGKQRVVLAFFPKAFTSG
jgi:peroxiredoxin Q/BCP